MARKVVLEDIQLNDQYIEQLNCLIDSAGRVYLFPLLFAYHTQVNGHVLRWITSKNKRTGQTLTQLINRRIEESSARTRFSHLKRFVEYVEKEVSEDAVHQVYSLDQSFYINYLENDLSKSLAIETIDSHITTLRLFINFLSFLEIRPSFDITISSKSRQSAADNNSDYSKPRYIPRTLRSQLLSGCNDRSQRLVLKMGCEVGLRAGELVGLKLDPEAKMKYGLRKLFDQVNDEKLSHIDEFEYTLLGKYTKRGTTRTLIFKRELLEEMRRYSLIERCALMKHEDEHGSFFVRSDNKGKGLPVSTQHASNIFRKIADEVSEKFENYTFHCLRHSFATELFNEELINSKGQETRAESAALLTVAKRLGHKVNIKTGKVSETTLRYISLRQEMKLMEANHGL